MTGIDIKKAHALSMSEARVRASRALERLKGPMGLDGAWNGDVYEFGKPTAGRLTLAAGSVRIEVALGTGLHVARGTVERRLAAEIDHWLGPSAGKT
jgi:putative polyhydroxyalkanoate system protein